MAVCRQHLLCEIACGEARQINVDSDDQKGASNGISIRGMNEQFFFSSQILIDYPLWNKADFRIRYFINNDCHCSSVHIGKQKCPFLFIFKFRRMAVCQDLLIRRLWENEPKANGALHFISVFTFMASPVETCASCLFRQSIYNQLP